MPSRKQFSQFQYVEQLLRAYSAIGQRAHQRRFQLHPSGVHDALDGVDRG
jgi:hypothetical protein